MPWSENDNGHRIKERNRFLIVFSLDSLNAFSFHGDVIQNINNVQTSTMARMDTDTDGRSKKALFAFTILASSQKEIIINSEHIK